MVAKFGKNYPVLARKSEKDRILFFAAAVLALSLVVVFLLVIRTRGADAKQADPSPVEIEPASIGTVRLYTPAKTVRAGQKLAGVEFKELFWPRNQVPQDAVRDIAEVATLYAKNDITPGAPLGRALLSSEPVRIMLPLTPFNRAIAIQVDEVSGVEGWAEPGANVDLTLTYRDGDKQTTALIVENARILSSGGDTARIPLRSRSQIPRRTTVTLDVSATDALKIENAKRLGRLNLSVRGSGESDDTSVTHSINQDQITHQESRTVKKECNKGTVTVSGKKYIVGCDNELSEIPAQ